MSIIDVVKAHPGMTAAVVGGVALAAYLLSGSSAAPATYQSGGNVEAATALQNAQLQATSESNQINAALQAHAGDTAASLEIAKLAASTSINNTEIAANVRMAEISAAQQVQSLTSTLSAQVATNAENKATERVGITTAGTVEQQRILANALTTQSANQAAAYIANSNAQAAIYSKAISCTGLKSLIGAC